MKKILAVTKNNYQINITNEQIYLQTVRPMIEAAFHKTKVTCFAYGQINKANAQAVKSVIEKTR